MRLRNIPGSRDIIAVSEFVVQDPETHRGHWREVFGNDHPIVLEIGIGKGRFLMELAERHPEKNFLGIEMYSSVLLRAIQRAEQRTTGAETPLPVSVRRRPHRPAGCNFRLLRFDASELPQLFEKGEIRQIYLNFSDPWPKDRHAERRLTSGRFLERYEQVLPPGGELMFKTDNPGLFTYSLEQIPARGWQLRFRTFDLHGKNEEGKDELSADNPGEGSAPEAEKPEGEIVSAAETDECREIMTEYEEKFVAEGKPICMLRAACS